MAHTDTRNGTLHAPLIYRLTRKITNAYKQNFVFFIYIYILFVCFGPMELFIEVPVSSQVSVRSCIVVW